MTKGPEQFRSGVTIDYELKNGDKVRMKFTPTDTGYTQAFICWPRLGSVRVTCRCESNGNVSTATGTCSDPYGQNCHCIDGRAVISCDGKSVPGSDPKPEFERSPGSTDNP